MTPEHMNGSMGHALARTCRLLHRRVHTLLGGVGLHRGQHFVLRALWELEGRTQTELANLTRVSPATITNMLQRMERDGLIERRQDPGDQRVSRVYPTAEGRRIREAAQGAWLQIEKEAFAGFTDAEVERLRELLGRVCVNLASRPNKGGKA
jgi:DNA-binding MarR family transcriptional regulator